MTTDADTTQDARDEADGSERVKSAAERAMERAEAMSSEDAEQTGDDAGVEVPEIANEATSESAGSEQADDFRDKYLRSVADFENFRKRTSKERERWTADAIRGMATDFIDVFDTLDMALSAVPEGVDETFLMGVKAVRDQFKGVLERRGVKRIECETGGPFDPDLHAALMMEESEEVEGTVIGSVLRPGYTLAGAVLRPTQVKVLKGAARG